MALFDETSNLGDQFILGHVIKSVSGCGEREFVEAAKWVEMSGESMLSLESRLQQAQVEWDIHHPKKAVSTSNQPSVGEKRSASVMLAEESAHVVTQQPGKIDKERPKSRCPKCKKLGFHTPAQCWKGTKCAICGEEHPTDKHERVQDLRKMRGEQKNTSTNTKVNICALYGNGKK